MILDLDNNKFCFEKRFHGYIISKMPFEVGDAFNQAAAKITKFPAVDLVIRNPLYVALLITAAIVLIIIFIFRDVDSDESLLKLSSRAGFWILLLTTCVMFLHHKLLSRELSGEAKDSELKHIFRGNHSDIEGAVESALIPVKIDTNFD